MTAKEWLWNGGLEDANQCDPQWLSALAKLCESFAEARNKELVEALNSANNQLRGIQLAESSKPLVCYRCGSTKGAHAVVYQYCHSCNTDAEYALAKNGGGE